MQRIAELSTRPATAGYSHAASETADHVLVAQATAGEERAFRELVRRHEAAVARVVVGMLGSGDEADDVGQETFVQLCRALGRFRGDASVRTYLTRIAINRSIDVLRQRRRRRHWLRLGSPTDDAHTEALTVAPHAAVEVDDQRAIVRRAIATLDAKHRAVVVLRFMEDHSTRETARILGVPEGTVMSRLKRALRKLETTLRPQVTA